MSEQSSKRVSAASSAEPANEWALRVNGWASGPVLTSIFLVILDYSASVKSLRFCHPSLCDSPFKLWRILLRLSSRSRLSIFSISRAYCLSRLFLLRLLSFDVKLSLSNVPWWAGASEHTISISVPWSSASVPWWWASPFRSPLAFSPGFTLPHSSSASRLFFLYPIPLRSLISSGQTRIQSSANLRLTTMFSRTLSATGTIMEQHLFRHATTVTTAPCRLRMQRTIQGVCYDMIDLKITNRMSKSEQLRLTVTDFVYKWIKNCQRRDTIIQF